MPLVSVDFVRLAVENVVIAAPHWPDADASVADAAHTLYVAPEHGTEAANEVSRNSPDAYVSAAEVRMRTPQPMSSA